MTTLKTLTIKFHEIPAGGLDYHLTNQSGELNSSLQDLLGDHPVYDVTLKVKQVDAMVHVKGQLSGKFNHLCSRCAEEFHEPFSKTFLTAYYKSDDAIRSLSQGVDEYEGSFDLELLEGNNIDLAETVHEQLALEIPFQPLCQSECKGLCTKCGTNLNNSQCACNPNIDITKHSPFEQLRALRGE